MRVEVLPEPDLEFGAGTHIDIRYGLRDYGPIGFDKPTTAKTINVGFVGSASTVYGVREWMVAARNGIPEKPSRKPKFRPAFPGFGAASPFRCEWVTEPRYERTIESRKLEAALAKGSRNEAIQEAVSLFLEECLYLDSSTNVDVIICAPPSELLGKLDAWNSRIREGTGRRFSNARSKSLYASGRDQMLDYEYDLHDLLKAKCLSLRRPIQFVRPPTFGESSKSASVRGRPKGIQDAATRAWNFHTALYYKAGGTPWRLLRRTSDLESCYVGVSFFRSIDKLHIHTSVAQVFNERGEGMILRGGEARMSKDDFQPHLSEEDMKVLLITALGAFEKEHHHLPARIVVHKTSGYSSEELKGCEVALQELHVRHRDLLVVRGTRVKLFRNGTYPPLRGTFVQLDEQHSILYSRGSVPFFEMYPGLYVPQALEIQTVASDESPKVLAQEILALTKMNWNNTQFDSSLPITIKAARQVGNILRYTSGDQSIQTRYAFFM